MSRHSHVVELTALWAHLAAPPQRALAARTPRAPQQPRTRKPPKANRRCARRARCRVPLPQQCAQQQRARCVGTTITATCTRPATCTAQPRADRVAVVRANARNSANVRSTPTVRAAVAAVGVVPPRQPPPPPRYIMHDPRALLPAGTTVRVDGHPRGMRYRVVSRKCRYIGKPGLHRVTYVIEVGRMRRNGQMLWSLGIIRNVPASDLVVVAFPSRITRSIKKAA
jgi:hypothetical protein